MANVSSYLVKAMLDWSLMGATPTRPANTFVSVGLAAPNSTSGSEIATGSGMTRQTCAFSAAASPGGGASDGRGALSSERRGTTQAPRIKGSSVKGRT